MFRGSPLQTIDPRLRADVQSAESCRLLAYRDSEGLWTIGWGHLLPQDHDWTGYRITQEQADSMFDLDMLMAQTGAATLMEFRRLNECRANAVTELVFNLGLNRWIGFQKCRKHLLNQEWQGAHDELLSSKWAEQVHETRANRLAGYLLTGAYP